MNPSKEPARAAGGDGKVRPGERLRSFLWVALPIAIVSTLAILYWPQ